MEYGGTNYGVTPVVWDVVKDKAMPPLQQLELFESLARDAAQSATREKKRADELEKQLKELKAGQHGRVQPGASGAVKTEDYGALELACWLLAAPRACAGRLLGMLGPDVGDHPIFCDQHRLGALALRWASSPMCCSSPMLFEGYLHNTASQFGEYPYCSPALRGDHPIFCDQHRLGALALRRARSRATSVPPAAAACARATPQCGRWARPSRRLSSSTRWCARKASVRRSATCA